MKYWLMKTEPGTYSFSDLKRDTQTEWSGIRNYAARNNMHQMKLGDKVFIYHSVEEKQIVGIAKVVKEEHQDSTDKTGVWQCVDIAFEKELKNPVCLYDIKNSQRLKKMKLVTHSRLSVQPVEKEEWMEVIRMSTK